MTRAEEHHTDNQDGYQWSREFSCQPRTLQLGLRIDWGMTSGDRMIPTSGPGTLWYSKQEKARESRQSQVKGWICASLAPSKGQ